MAAFISGSRVWLLGAWPQYTVARRGLGWSMYSLGSSTASNQRDTVVPGRSISSLEPKRESSQL